MDARDSIKVPKNCVTKEEDDYIRRRLNWLKRNAIYGLGIHASNAEIAEIMKGNDNSPNLEI